jgi:hypothetical protein
LLLSSVLIHESYCGTSGPGALVNPGQLIPSILVSLCIVATRIAGHY